MVNYGYDQSSKNWKSEHKLDLANKLSKELDLKIGWGHDTVNPYIEVDGLYEGVRIRRITHLSETAIEELVNKADKIYHEVMDEDNE